MVVDDGWCSAGKVRQQFGIPSERLRDFVQRGLVRSAKLGKSRQSARVYKMADVRDVLQALASGRTPKRPRLKEHGDE